MNFIQREKREPSESRLQQLEEKDKELYEEEKKTSVCYLIVLLCNVL